MDLSSVSSSSYPTPQPSVQAPSRYESAQSAQSYQQTQNYQQVQTDQGSQSPSYQQPSYLPNTTISPAANGNPSYQPGSLLNLLA